MLCYTCDEHFVQGHKCKSKFYLLVHQDDNTANSSASLSNSATTCDDLNSLSILDNSLPYQVDLLTPHISLHALVGNATTENLRIHGTIKIKKLSYS